MPYRDIIVQLDSAAATARYRIAAEIAARGGGHVTGLFLKTSLIMQYRSIDPIAYLPPDDLNRVIREHGEAQDRQALASGAALADVAKAFGADCDRRVISGDTPDPMVAEARCTDLAVMPPPQSAPNYSVDASAVDVALGGAPVLVVPDDAPDARVGQRVLLAWNGGREVARALHAAAPLLADGAVVEVRMAHPRGEADGDPSALVRRHLERLGLKPNVALEPHHEDATIATWLTAEAAKAGCDMIVMGVYGHTRLREFVLGGVSRALLHHPPLPLLIAH